MDRRQFLARMTALSAAAAAGAISAPGLPDLAAAAARAPSPPADPAPHAAARNAGTSGRPTIAWNEAAYAARVRPEAMADLCELTISEAAALIRAGRISPVQLTEAFLDRIRRLDGAYRAFNLVLAEQARFEARRLAESPHAGPLHGIPLAIKDNYYTAGVPTTANSLLFQDFVPSYDAAAIAALRAAGAILLGKTQMGPLATTRASTPAGEVTTVNAWAPDLPSVSPGGSSSGSATAVAARLAVSALGTQTGGSITGPAMAQGLTGLKPTVGRVSLHGVIPLAYTRDTAGPIARDAMDAAILLQAIAGRDPADPRTAHAPPVPDFVLAASPATRNGRPALRWQTRIGVLPGYADGDSEPAAARRALLAALESLGAEFVDVVLPEDWNTLTRLCNDVRLAERSEAFLPYLRQDVRRFGVALPSWINGLLLGSAEHLKAQRLRMVLLRAALDEVFASCDVVLQTTPVAFDVLGLPQIAFPIGFTSPSESPRPIGALLGGLPFGEERLLSIAAAYQSITDWHLHRPPDPRPSDGRAGTASRRGRIRAEDMMELSE